MRKREPLLKKDKCILAEMVARKGIICSPDVLIIADNCNATVEYVHDIINASNNKGKDINQRVNKSLAHVPLNSDERIMAYAQVMLEDKLNRRRINDLQLTDRDPLDILDFARKLRHPERGTNIQINNANQPQMFDFSGWDTEQLQRLVSRVQSAIETGNIEAVDAEFREIEDSLAILPGRSSDAEPEAISEGAHQAEE
jgi:hypothetical protein